jgi:peroxiredoxin
MTSRPAAVILCLALLLGCGGGPSVEVSRIKPGDEAPAFALKDISTSQQISSEKVVQGHHATVITIWSMACPNCREALLEVEKIYEEYGPKTVAFLGVNFDRENLQGIKVFAKAEGIGFPILWDNRRRVVRSYQALDYTFSVFVINRAGEVVLAQYDHPPDLHAILTETLDRILQR